MYPGSACYDPQRPSILPYYLDTWSESVCSYERLAGKDTRLNFLDPLTGPAPASPMQVENPTAASINAWTPEQLAAQDAINWETWSANPFPDPPGGDPKPTNYLLWAAAGVALLFIFGGHR